MVESSEEPSIEFDNQPSGSPTPGQISPATKSEETFDLDRTKEDISSYTLPQQGEVIVREELGSSLKPFEFKTYTTHFDGIGFEYSRMYSFVLTTHTDNNYPDPLPFERNISFLIGQGDLTPFETMSVSSGSDYAYIIRALAQKNYREATQEDWDFHVGNTDYLICYIENPDGTIDQFWFDGNYYVLHMTADELMDDHFKDISTEPLTEEEYVHLNVIAASYLYAETDLCIVPFKYQSIRGQASSAISVKIIKDDGEVVLEDEMTDRLIEAVKATDEANAGDKTLYSCALNESIDWDKMVHFLVIDKKEHTWEDGVYHDDFYMTGEGIIIRKLDTIRSTIIGGSEGMSIRGPFIVSSLYTYPIEDIIIGKTEE